MFKPNRAKRGDISQRQICLFLMPIGIVKTPYNKKTSTKEKKKMEKIRTTALKKEKSKPQLISIVIALTTLIVLTLILSANLASAEQLLCLTRGNKVKFSECNPSIHDYTCAASSCQLCVRRCSNGAYGPASPNACNTQNLVCTFLNDSSVDVDPPNLTISNPQEGGIYQKSSLLLNLTTDESSTIDYLDLINGKGKWLGVCKNCYSYSKPRSFKEGRNNLTFRARDPLGNTRYLNLSFTVDSKKPKIKKTEPKKGFSSGMFSIDFMEDNPVSLILTYGNNLSGFQAHALDINSCSLNKGIHSCSTDVPVDSYDGQEIQYYFNLTDIAGSSVSSKPIKLKVDVTSPIINSLNYSLSKTIVNFIINVTEQNFDDITYIDNSALTPRERTLCSSLKNGICDKKVSFKAGHHDIDIQVNDKAGNAVSQNLQIHI